MLSTDYRKFLRPGFELGKGGKLFQSNDRLILNQVFWGENVTQRQIIDSSQIPQQTVSRLIKALMDKGAIIQAERKSDGSRGQPGYCIETNASYAYCFGVSIQADSIVVVLMNFSGEIIASKNQVLGSMSVNNVIEALKSLMADMVKEKSISDDRILGLGVGISGYFLALDGNINTMLDEWTTIDIAMVIAQQVGLPVWVENDAKAAAAGEGIAGVGRKYKNFVYLYIGIGFGGGVIMNGEIMRGAHGNAGEVAEMLPPKIYLHPNLELLRQIIIRNGVEIGTVSELLEKFDINWPGNEEWISKVKDSLSLVASSCAALLDTQAIVIGGRIPKELAELLVDQISIYAQNRRSLPRSLPDLLVAQAHGDSVAIGAATLPFRACCL